MSYRDAAVVLRERADEINNAADAMCKALGLEEDTYYEQARMLALSLAVNGERNAGVHDAWRGVGFIGNLLTLHGKIVRLMNSLFWNNGQADLANEKPLDNAIDAMVYCGFFSRLYIDKNSHGAPPVFTAKTPTEQKQVLDFD